MNKKGDRRIEILHSEGPTKAVIKLGFPLVAGMMIMVLYNLVDAYYIGLMHDDYCMAAVNLAYPILMITMALSNIIGTGVSSLMARSIGSKDIQRSEYTLSVGILLTIINGFAVAFIGILLIDPVVYALGAEKLTFLYTKQYVEILLIGSIFTMSNYTLGQFLRAEGSVNISIACMFTGTIFNIILDPFFIFTLSWGISGAALATIIGNASGMLIALFYYLRGKTLCKIQFLRNLPDKRIVWEIYRVGLPAALETFITSLTFIVMNNLAVTYGELIIAAMGISQKIMSFGCYIYQGLSAGIQPLMGYNYGSRNYTRMISILKAGLFVVSITELAVMVVYGGFSQTLVSFFSSSRLVTEISAKVLRVNMWILPFVGAVSMSRVTFQAMGKPQYALLITFVRQIIFYIPLLYVLNVCFGFYGLLWAQPITEFIMMFGSVLLLMKIIKFMR